MHWNWRENADKRCFSVLLRRIQCFDAEIDGEIQNFSKFWDKSRFLGFLCVRIDEKMQKNR